MIKIIKKYTYSWYNKIDLRGVFHMENLKKMIKMHSIKVIFVWLFFIVIAVTLMIVGDITPKSLISYCKVYNEDDLSRRNSY